MAETFGSRFGLRNWGAPTDGPSRTEFNDIFTLIEQNAAMFVQGTRANRPASGKAGRLYLVTGDATSFYNGMVFWDTGSAWLMLGTAVESPLVKPSASGSVGLIIQGLAGQTVALQQWKDSTGAVVAAIDQVGAGSLASLAVVGISTHQGAATFAGTVTFSGTVTAQTINATVLTGEYRSTSLRVDGTPKINLKPDGTGRHDGLLPPGSIVMSAASAAPAGWLICSGGTVSRATYADLFAVIGTTYGAGDGSTTFSLPDMRDRFPIQQSSGGKALGASGGQDSVNISASQMPSHAHNFNHTHDTTIATGGAGNSFLHAAPSIQNVNIGTIQTSGPNEGYTTTNTGAGLPVDTTPKFLAVNFLIKT